jgi:toxin ParE1/3/4
MSPLIFSPKAARDIDEIWEYSARRWDVDQAERYIGTIREACEALGRRERLGLDASTIRASYRRLRCGSHVIFYRRISDEMIEIIRILHQQMDFARHL